MVQLKQDENYKYAPSRSRKKTYRSRNTSNTHVNLRCLEKDHKLFEKVFSAYFSLKTAEKFVFYKPR